MQEQEIRNILDSVRSRQTESRTFEAKTASEGCPKKIYDTLSSFSNQDEGGVIMFGVDDKNEFAVTGVYDAADIQKKIQGKCREMEPKIRPVLSVGAIDGKQVVAAEIQGVEYADRPVFYRPAGINNGSYIRIGDSDEHMTAYEIYKYQAYRKGLKEDQRPVKDGWVLRNGELMNKYLSTVKASRINTFEHLSDSEILQLQKVENDGCPTLAGLLVFSKYPQSAFPGLGITAVAVPGTVYGVTEADGTRFTDNVRIEGSLQEMLVSAMDFVRKNIRHRTVIDEMGQRADRWEYPLRAVREALLNALIHRDYSRHTDGTPIQLIIYEDRMEIINSGGVYGGVPVARLGKESPESRNSTLIRILEFLQISENRYSGIPTMKREMEKAGLPQPEFLDDGKQFKTILRNTVSSSAASLPARTENKADERIAVYCRTPRTRKEIADHLGMNYSYVSNGLIKPMILSGTLVEAGKKGREKLLQTRTDWSQREFEPVTEG